MLKMATKKRRRAKISLIIAILFILQTFLSSGVVYAAPVEEGAYGDMARISALQESGTEENASPESGTWDREEGAEDAEISSESTASLQGINSSKEEASFKVNRTGTRSGKLPKIVSDAIGSGNGSGVVEMFDDIRITSPIKVPSGKTLTLIMNGHSIDRNMGKSKGDGMIFLLEENSTLRIEGGSGQGPSLRRLQR